MTEPYRSVYNEEYYIKHYSPILRNKYDLRYLDYLDTIAFTSPRGKEVLEVGCGLGTLSWGLSAHASLVIGLDISKYAICKAKEQYRGEKLSFLIASGEFLPFKKNCFDCVVCSHLFEHLSKEEHENVQREIWRVLRSEGYIVVEQPYDAEPLSVLSLVMTRIYTNLFRIQRIGEPDETHKQRYTVQSLINQLEKSFSIRCFRLNHKWSILVRAIFLLLGMREPDTWYVKLYLSSPEWLRWLIFFTPFPKIMANKQSHAGNYALNVRK